jgi:hypothetical protein
MSSPVLVLSFGEFGRHFHCWATASSGVHDFIFHFCHVRVGEVAKCCQKNGRKWAFYPINILRMHGFEV